MFHSEVQNNHDAIASEERSYMDIPFVSKVSKEDIIVNYEKIKTQVATIVESELKRISGKNGVKATNGLEEEKFSNAEKVKNQAKKSDKMKKNKPGGAGGLPISL